MKLLVSRLHLWRAGREVADLLDAEKQYSNGRPRRNSSLILQVGEQPRRMSGMGNKWGPALPTLTATRVQLRWLTDEDVPSLFTIFGDREVTCYWGHPVLPDQDAAITLLRDIETKFAQRSLFQWGIALRDSDTVIGTCTLAALDPENRRAELGFALARAYWGKGYMSEALPILLQFGFCEMQLRRIWADTDPRNRSSIHILERLGFQREGLLREHYLVHGDPQDAIVYGLLKPDWQRDRLALDMNRTPEAAP